MTKIVDPDTLNTDSIVRTSSRIKTIKKVEGDITFDDMVKYFKKLLNWEE